MTEIKTTKIPRRQKCVDKDHPYIGGSVDVIDDALGKPQSQVNQEIISEETNLDSKIAAEKTRAQGVEDGLNTRLQTVEELAEISVGGGDIGIGTAADFESDDPEDLAKVPTIGAMLGGANDGVYDISARHSGATYADLAAALGTNGANIPQSLRKGGMSVKFVQSSDNNKYVRYNLLAQLFTTDITQWAIDDGGVYVDNPEYVYVNTDKDGKILWAIEKNGNIHYGAGVPQQVIDYIQAKISELSLDEYEDIVAFLNGLEEGDKTLQTLLNEKVDKEEGKSLIDEDYASSQSAIDNPEFLEITLDAEDKVLEGIQKDGTKVIGGDFKVLGNMKVSDISYTVIENPEYLAAWVDANGKLIFGFKTDGKTYVGDADFLDDIESIKAFLVNLNDKNIDWDALTSITATENPEFIEAKTDSEGKLLAGRTTDGAAFESVGFSTSKLSINGHTIENIEDPEGRIEIKTDSEGKIISYSDSHGVKHEEAGFETPSINGLKTINGKDISDFGSSEDHSSVIPLKNYNLPKYGSVNIKSETFYLASPTPISDRSEVYIFQDYEATGNNFINKVTLSYYYLVSSLVDNGDGTYSKYNDGVEGHDIKLDFYTGKEVKKVDGVYYVKASLDTPNPIVVYQIVGKPDLLTWAVNKNSEHYCLVDVDFGTYLTQQDMAVGVKFQGNSTIAYPKKNLRFTFYKNNEYSKKLKVQIGELIPANKYNLKAYWKDSSLVREHACYRMVQAIRETHDYNDQYPWNEGKGFVPDATGLTNGFPIRVDVGGNFQGVYWFGLAKDINNFMLNDETMNGVLIQGDGGYGPTFWQILDSRYWSDLLADIDNDISEDSLPHVQAWYDYLNGSTFSRETASAHFNIKNWIDCIIILQTFGAIDMTSSNLILYAGEDKTVFSPMYYDMDWTWGFRCSWSMSTFDNTQTKDQSLWVKLQSILKDEIEARYKELRSKIINMEYINNLIVGFGRQIPYSAYEEEIAKWPDMPLTPTDEGRVGSVEEILDWMQKRITFMDNYFHYEI